ncbi:CopD family protein [Temperatibacter marinus]|uniref:Protoporphyrinogen IX oxidase n=1 Tax=Temperatibacter marinus TaxID=1456591 RepID=A0AA52HAI8_9PROT|nr:CopD family protein [Temperatibacter marinus]WND03667.1 CopD family protein [Temperatibacter marinus]
MDLLTDYYSVIKALHIIFVIYWMAGLLMIPRFYVYHHQSALNSDEDALWMDRESRLFKIILNPAMIISLVFGLLLVGITHVEGQGWFQLKFLLVIGLMIFHMMMAAQRKKFAAQNRPRSEKYFRMMNEVPSILILGIVLLAVVKPF